MIKSITHITDYLDENWNPVESKKNAYWIHELSLNKNGQITRCKLLKNLDQKNS